MAEKKLTFSKVVILSVDRKPESGKVKLSCAPSKNVAKAMSWGDSPDWLKSATPEGKLTVTLAEFEPIHGDLKKHAFDLQQTKVMDGFEFVRVQVKTGKTAKKAPTYRNELHCALTFTDPKGAGKIEQYFGLVQESTLKITYNEAATQEELPGATDEQRQALLPEND